MLYHNGGEVTKGRRGAARGGEETMPPEEKELPTGPNGSRGQKGRSTGSEGSGRDQETRMLKMRTWGEDSTGWVERETPPVRSRKQHAIGKGRG